MATRDDRQTGAARALIGRSAEFELITAFLDRAATVGQALLLFGEPGVGKTALLDAAADAASAAGMLVLRANGVEFEADLSYSGLHQALLPLFEEFARLNPPHREALTVALGFGSGPAPERLVVCNATLTVLRRAATARPVFVVVDDLPWLDRVSAGVLGFVARRLAGSRVGFLAALRSGEQSSFERAGLPQHEVAPLDEPAAAGLVNARFPALAPNLRQRALTEGQGNPLALLELSVALGGSPLAAGTGPPTAAPLSAHLQAMYASRVTALPARTRRLLLLMALDGTGDPRVLRAGRSGSRSLEDLAVAERARLSWSCQARFRACWAAQAPPGCSLQAVNRMRRLASSKKNKT